MKLFCSLLLLIAGSAAPLFAQSTALFADDRVSRIDIELPADSLKEMLDSLENDHYYDARFIFNDGQVEDTVFHIGLRLRGNTSLGAQKKSFKISFNEFEAGREYQGVRKLNLRGSHNDPTMIREKLFYEAWENAGMPLRRSNFVRVYINGEYRGLYTNMEEIDKQWLKRAFDDNDGNLFKCTYPADLVYKGPIITPYKALMNGPETRAYDLVTNEAADDYTRLVQLIRTLNQPLDDAYVANIKAILNVESALKCFALDVATGNWDDYFFNRNNYYLYDNPATGRFEFFTFDTDNTFGVDWFGIDWTQRNCLNWQSSQARPLADKLLQVPEFFDQYVHYLDSITRFVVRPAVIFPTIDAYRQLITAAAAADQYRSLDYGYTMNDFYNGFTQTVDGHTPYGIKPFLETRYDSTLQQLARLATTTTENIYPSLQASIFPNPAISQTSIQVEGEQTGKGTLEDLYGRVLKTWQWQNSTSPHTLLLQDLPAGAYRVRVQAGERRGNWLLYKTDSGK